MKRSVIVGIAALVLLAGGVTVFRDSAVATAEPGIEQLKVKVLEERPHASDAFTQGFEIADGVLYESTGLTGRSTLRATDPLTGAVRKQAALAPEQFAEGATVVGDQIWQITWQEGKALLWDRNTLVKIREARYDGEGWGLCFDGHRLVMSDGTDLLTFRDPKTFAKLGEIRVNADGVPVININELECTTDGVVLANIWKTDRIIRIDSRDGKVVSVVDAAGLHQATDPDDVLNGVAAIPGTDEFLITGKRWPVMYRVALVPADK